MYTFPSIEKNKMINQVVVNFCTKAFEEAIARKNDVLSAVARIQEELLKESPVPKTLMDEVLFVMGGPGGFIGIDENELNRDDHNAFVAVLSGECDLTEYPDLEALMLKVKSLDHNVCESEHMAMYEKAVDLIMASEHGEEYREAITKIFSDKREVFSEE